ncbi:aldehyde dehydrogenase family protein, partial [Paenarthrobacter ureafaciens]|uniref:aldehyde dehydrogenase family protein n=1 Tax=Paenarthrobacter ureafaciens TaxID=37931 RepID=UPI00397BAFAE
RCPPRVTAPLQGAGAAPPWATSRRFNQQLIDAARSLKVGYPADPQTQMGPVIEPANGKLLGGLTTLGPGEHWDVHVHARHS